MAYTLSNFTPGWKLTSEDMNKIDNQVYQNYLDIDEIKDVENVARALQSNLTLTEDSASIYLVYIDPKDSDPNTNKHVIASASKGVDFNTYVPISSYTIGEAPSEIYVGVGFEVGGNVQPSDTSIKPAWKTSDVTIATVTSTGVITGKNCGTVTVTTWAGSTSYSFIVTVKRKVYLDNINIVESNGLGWDGYFPFNNDDGFTNPEIRFVDGNNYCVVLVDKDKNWKNNMYVKDGEKLTITYDTDHMFLTIMLFTTTNTEVNSTDYDGMWKFVDATGLKESAKHYNETFTYTNTTGKNVYFLIQVTGRDSDKGTDTGITPTSSYLNSISIISEAV